MRQFKMDDDVAAAAGCLTLGGIAKESGCGVILFIGGGLAALALECGVLSRVFSGQGTSDDRFTLWLNVAGIVFIAVAWAVSRHNSRDL